MNIMQFHTVSRTAENGTWMPGPGMKLFQAIEKRAWKTGNYCGRSRLSDRECPSDVERKWIPGNEVIQFAFDPNGGSAYLPHNYPENSVVYTGTHDNDTTRGWYHSTDKATRDFAKEYMNAQRLDEDDLAWDFIRLAMSSKANLCVTPMQDLLTWMARQESMYRLHLAETGPGEWRRDSLMKRR